MKNISVYNAKKYDNSDKYTFVEENIYLFKNSYDSIEDGMYVYGNMKTSAIQPDYYVTSLSFEQEPLLGEGESPQSISQYPLEDILDKFFLHISDFYHGINDDSDTLCYLEFASDSIDDIRSLLDIVGKHVYNKEYESDGKNYIELIID